MAFELMPLPYDPEALEPAVSARTLSFHHGKHHKAYIDKTNAAIEGTDNAGKSLEEIIAAARGSNQGLFNNSAQSWNHGFYWNSLAPSGGSPSGDLASKIDAAFGSLDELKAKLVERGVGHFSNGWVWLADSGKNPLLTIDLWEHAYYLDYQNVRPDYLKAVLDNHLNWDFATENLERGSAWKYPA